MTSSSYQCKIAVAQITTTDDIQANYKKCKKLIEDALQTHPDVKVVFFPENFDFVAKNRNQAILLASPLDCDLIRDYRELAKSNAVWLSLGGFHELNSNRKLFNTHILINSNGEIVSLYRKYHLFDISVPNGPNLMESAQTDSGYPTHPQAVVKSPAGTLGLSVCYDLRFPEFFRRMSLLHPAGIDVIVVPATWTLHTAPHWETLLRARAIENQAYVVAAAQIGKHNENRQSPGQSMVVDPWGTVIARASDREQFLIATIDLNFLKQIRQQMPVLNHAITAFYSKL